MLFYNSFWNILRQSCVRSHIRIRNTHGFSSISYSFYFLFFIYNCLTYSKIKTTFSTFTKFTKEMENVKQFIIYFIINQGHLVLCEFIIMHVCRTSKIIIICKKGVLNLLCKFVILLTNCENNYIHRNRS